MGSSKPNPHLLPILTHTKKRKKNRHTCTIQTSELCMQRWWVYCIAPAASWGSSQTAVQSSISALAPIASATYCLSGMGRVLKKVILSFRCMQASNMASHIGTMWNLRSTYIITVSHIDPARPKFRELLKLPKKPVAQWQQSGADAAKFQQVRMCTGKCGWVWAVVRGRAVQERTSGCCHASE